MALVKIVTESEFDAISQAINNGEGFPTPPESEYRCDTWLDKSSCYHPTLGYYIPQDEITEKYTSGFDTELPPQNTDII